MSTKNKKATFKKFESRKANSKYIRITKDMMESEAWAKLDVYDTNAYIHFKSKYYENNRIKTSNEKDISLTYKEMSKAMSSDRYKKSIDNLLEYGFIDIVKHSPQTRDATIYGLSSRWHDYGNGNFKKASRPKLSRKKNE